MMARFFFYLNFFQKLPKIIIATQIRSIVKYKKKKKKKKKVVPIFPMHNDQPQQNPKNNTTIYIQTQQNQ